MGASISLPQPHHTNLTLDILSEINIYHWTSLYLATYICIEMIYFPDSSSEETPTVLNFSTGG